MDELIIVQPSLLSPDTLFYQKEKNKRSVGILAQITFNCCIANGSFLTKTMECCTLESKMAVSAMFIEAMSLLIGGITDRNHKATRHELPCSEWLWWQLYTVACNVTSRKHSQASSYSIPIMFFCLRELYSHNDKAL